MMRMFNIFLLSILIIVYIKHPHHHPLPFVAYFSTKIHLPYTSCSYIPLWKTTNSFVTGHTIGGNRANMAFVTGHTIGGNRVSYECHVYPITCSLQLFSPLIRYHILLVARSITCRLHSFFYVPLNLCFAVEDYD
jgi:hypothetical protein